MKSLDRLEFIFAAAEGFTACDYDHRFGCRALSHKADHFRLGHVVDPNTPFFAEKNPIGPIVSLDRGYLAPLTTPNILRSLGCEADSAVQGFLYPQNVFLIFNSPSKDGSKAMASPIGATSAAGMYSPPQKAEEEHEQQQKQFQG